MCGLSDKWARKLIKLVKIAGCSGAQGSSTRGLWSADGALQATRKPRLEAPLAHMFQGAGSKGIKLRRRHAARQGIWPEPALGSSVR